MSRTLDDWVGVFQAETTQLPMPDSFTVTHRGGRPSEVIPDVVAKLPDGIMSDEPGLITTIEATCGEQTHGTIGYVLADQLNTSSASDGQLVAAHVYGLMHGLIDVVRASAGVNA